jgi:hypothetical protein
MTREEAIEECERLAAESPDRSTHRWMPCELEAGQWTVVKVNLAPAGAMEPVPETRAQERPLAEAPPQTRSPGLYPGA